MKNINIDFLIRKKACDGGVDWLESQNTVDFYELYELAKKDGLLLYVNWYIAKLMNKTQAIKYAIFAAESVVDVWNDYDFNDTRPQDAIDAAKNYLINGSIDATDDAADDAYTAADDAYAAYAYNAAAAANAANAAANAAYTADDAYTAYNAAYNAANAANAAYTMNGTETLIKIIDYGIELLEN